MYRVTYESSKPIRSRGSKTPYWYDEIKEENVLPTFPKNSSILYDMVESKIRYPTSQSDVGNARLRKGKALKRISPSSKNGKVKHLKRFDIGNGQSILLEME